MVDNLKRALLDQMRQYMLDAEPGYEQRHIDKCRDILERYSAAISEATDEAAAKECVRQTVLELNALNTQARESLIETGEREQLWEIITKAGTARGFFVNEDDVTEQWREW